MPLHLRHEDSLFFKPVLKSQTTVKVQVNLFSVQEKKYSLVQVQLDLTDTQKGHFIFIGSSCVVVSVGLKMVKFRLKIFVKSIKTKHSLHLRGCEVAQILRGHVLSSKTHSVSGL